MAAALRHGSERLAAVIHEAQQCEQRRIEGPDDADHAQGEAMLDPLHCLFQFDLGRREIRLCHEIRDDVFGKSLRLRLGGMAVDAGGFEVFAVGERID